ncbi:MAG TPA: hypothetical protein VF472_00140 [Burkholderiaceae bacterium]
MKREPRGFHFTLEPLRTKCDWDLQRMNLELAQLNGRIDEQNELIRQRRADLAASVSEFTEERNKTQVIYADRQRLAHEYLARQAKQLQVAEKILADLEMEREIAVAILHRQKKLADELEENRAEEIKDYAKMKAQTENAEADDAWLRAMKWRTMQ